MFETVFAGHPAPARRALAGPLSIALHAAAIAAVVVGSAWRISDPGEPNVPIILVTPAPPPPPAAPGPAASPRSKSGNPPSPPASALARPVLLSPSAIPVGIDSLPEPTPLDLLSTGETGSARSGSPEGVDGGTGDSGPAGFGTNGAPISAAAPDVVPPRLLSQAQPEYPETARRIREQGLVLLQAVIGTSGTVEDLRVLSSTSPLFEDAALRAVRLWRYRPATLAGRAVRVYLTVTIRFTLK